MVTAMVQTRRFGGVGQRRLVLMVCALLAITASARGAIFITIDPILGSPIPTFTITQLPGGKYEIELNTAVVTQPSTFTVRGASSDQIESITINAMVPQTVFVNVRGLSAGTPLASVDLIDMGASTATVILSDLRTTGNVGSIYVNTITSTNVGGDVTGDIVLLPRTGGGESTIIGATVNGRIHGDVLVDHGAIFGLTASGGIGSAGNPSQIRTKNNIVRITTSSLYADITTLANGGVGVTGEIRTTSGPFVGSLNTAALRSTGTGEPGVLSIFGDLDADVTIVGAVSNENNGLPVINVGGNFVAGRRLIVGTSLNAGAEIRINASQGLKGQALINFNNWAHAWNGPVRVGGALLGPIPEYSQTSASLGGGSVGQAPFALHGSDCLPVRGAVISGGAAPDINNPILMRHYGPVTWVSGGTPPVTVDRRPIAEPNAWVDQTACFFVGREQVPNPNPNVIAIFPVRRLQGGFVYRIKPVRIGSNMLQSDIESGFNPPVALDTIEYTFTVLGSCVGDADGNGVVNFGDINAVLANWGGGAGCLPTGDADSNGLINFQDITAVIANWGGSCVADAAEWSADDGHDPAHAPEAEVRLRVRDAAKALGWAEPGPYLQWLGALDERSLATALENLNQTLDRQGETGAESASGGGER